MSKLEGREQVRSAMIALSEESSRMRSDNYQGYRKKVLQLQRVISYAFKILQEKEATGRLEKFLLAKGKHLNNFMEVYGSEAEKNQAELEVFEDCDLALEEF